MIIIIIIINSLFRIISEQETSKSTYTTYRKINNGQSVFIEGFLSNFNYRKQKLSSKKKETSYVV